MSHTLYQHDRFREAVGDELRPGGLRITEELGTACALQAGERVLDLGCGVGSTASYLRRRWCVEAYGLDASPELLAEAKERDPEVQWVLSPAEDLPFPDGYFDAVFAECFLSIVEDPGVVLGEVGRILRPAGRLALSDLYLRDPGAGDVSLAPPASCLRGATGAATTRGLLEHAGFSIQLWEDRSDMLKTLMASLIFAYGSEAAFWKASGSAEPAGAILEAIRGARPGYFLLVAGRHPRGGRPSGSRG